MEFDDDFFFEEDKILMEKPALPAGNALFDNSYGSSKGEDTIPVTTVSSTNVELHQLAMMEDRIPDIELVAQRQLSPSNQICDQVRITFIEGSLF
ncbi:hypothetical protein KM043_007592 [Ampulex compressa]|nr:hypothetical protein KM043_007592 [Ampulex compressa]